jgi:hypothetical protein
MKQQGLLACIKQRRDEDTKLKEGGGIVVIFWVKGQKMRDLSRR